MRRAVLATVALAAACSKGPPGQACAHDPALFEPTELQVVLDPPPPSIRRELTVAELGRYPGAEALGPSGKLQGLTVGRQELRYRSSIALRRRLFGGPKCAWLEKLVVDLSPRSIEILVPKEYAPGSCQDEQILQHEGSHVDTMRDELELAAGDIRLALRKADWLPGRATPLAVADRAEAERRIEDMLDKAVKPVYDAHLERMKERQAVIDRPENYRWTSGRCQSWR